MLKRVQHDVGAKRVVSCLFGRDDFLVSHGNTKTQKKLTGHPELVSGSL